VGCPPGVGAGSARAMLRRWEAGNSSCSSRICLASAMRSDRSFTTGENVASASAASRASRMRASRSLHPRNHSHNLSLHIGYWGGHETKQAYARQNENMGRSAEFHLQMLQKKTHQSTRFFCDMSSLLNDEFSCKSSVSHVWTSPSQPDRETCTRRSNAEDIKSQDLHVMAGAGMLRAPALALQLAEAPVQGRVRSCACVHLGHKRAVLQLLLVPLRPQSLPLCNTKDCILGNALS
jgi:hypothetical protein